MPPLSFWEIASSFIALGAAFGWLFEEALANTARDCGLLRHRPIDVRPCWRVDEMGVHTWDLKPGVRVPFVGSGYDRESV